MPFRRYSGAAGGGDFTLEVSVHNGRLRRRGMPVFTGRNKRGRDTKVSLPLLTPLTFLCADTSEMCSETGVRGTRFRASGRFWNAVMP